MSFYLGDQPIFAIYKGSVRVYDGGGLTLAGLVSLSEIGAVSITATYPLTLTGIESASEIGAVSIGSDAIISIVGLESASEVGVLSVSGTYPLTIVGIESASEVGSLDISGAVPISLTGLESLSEVGGMSISAVHPLILTGIESAAEIGSLGVSVVYQMALTGIESASEVGSLDVSIAAPTASNITLGAQATGTGNVPLTVTDLSADATVYVAAYDSAQAGLTATQLAAGQNNGGTGSGVVMSDSGAVTSGSPTVNLTIPDGVDPATTLHVYACLGDPLGVVWDLGTTTWDTEDPTILSLSPADGATGVAAGANLVLVFSESMDTTPPGPTLVEVYNAADDSLIMSFDIDAGAGVWSTTTVANDTLTLDPVSDFANGIDVYVHVSGFVDVYGNPLADILNTTGWNFSVAAAATAPAAMVGDTHFSVTDDGTGGDATIAFITAPSDGGSAITGYEYRIGAGGAWTPATFPQAITGLTNGTPTDIYCRAINAVGPSASDGTPDSVTATDVPAAMVGDTNFSLTDNATGGDATLTLLSAPAMNGAAFVRYDYRIGAGGTWTDAGSLASPLVLSDLFTDGVATDVYCRAVNATGNGPDGTPDSVTTTAAPSYTNVLHKSNDLDLFQTGWTGVNTATPWSFSQTPASVTALGSDWFRITNGATLTELVQDNLSGGRSGFSVDSAAARWFLVLEARLATVGTAATTLTVNFVDFSGGGDSVSVGFNLSTGSAAKSMGTTTVFGMTNMGGGEYRCWIAIDKGTSTRLNIFPIKSLIANNAVEMRRVMLTQYPGSNSDVPTWIDGPS